MTRDTGMQRIILVACHRSEMGCLYKSFIVIYVEETFSLNQFETFEHEKSNFQKL